MFRGQAQGFAEEADSILHGSAGTKARFGETNLSTVRLEVGKGFGGKGSCSGVCVAIGHGGV